MSDVRSSLSPKRLRERLYSMYVDHFTQATVVKGTLKGTTLSCRCMLVMKADSPFENYLLNRMYGDSFERVRVKTIWIPTLAHWSKHPPSDVDFIIASLPTRWDEAFAGLHTLKSPTIVRQALDLSGDWGDIKKRLNRKKREVFNSLMTSNRYEYRISNDPRDFHEFYHRMYSPHTRKQFKAAARIDSYESLESKFRRGFLLLLTDGGKDVAGSLCSIDGNTMGFHRGGVLDGSEEHVKNGAQTALYFFKVRYAKERNLERLDLQHSRAFFDDGVYRHKREWGASVSIDDDLVSWMYLFDPRRSPQAARFLHHNPLIVRTPEAVLGYHVALTDTAVAAAKQGEMEKRYFSPGLAGVMVRASGSHAASRFDFGGAVNRA